LRDNLLKMFRSLLRTPQIVCTLKINFKLAWRTVPETLLVM
jgi:hypothetical protein